ncbi:hypothetical protein ASE73_02675 [Sphingomonas sp. Leaf24]|uniref:helix-turn-helix domain-containing protein n=1 Tax=unclassified Sphingomonas TaxID=196159 RepID=UPI0006F9BBD1|nr:MULTISPECIES: helix-turn-helix domain-containing protein [unclassified Sphingomonas]KQM23148.1 hypothetical protein ASE50_02675 [Sphingomonas sp. Leaf5]KQM96006.1 hypothetical protein ASE73_02675 [Sphingomonas sp. Leaf24]
MSAALERRVARIEAALGLDPAATDAPPLIATIVATTAATFDVSADRIRGVARDRDTVRARFAAIWTIRHLNPNLSLRQIAEALGRRDHNSILHALARAKAWRRDDAAFRVNLDRVARIAAGKLSASVGGSAP